jgi:hypothetical protein
MHSSLDSGGDDDAGWVEPVLKATTWKVADGKVCGTERVGVFVLWTGMVADLPMRCKLYKNVQWSATYFCEQCGLKGEKAKFEGGRMGAVRAMGCGPKWNSVRTSAVRVDIRYVALPQQTCRDCAGICGRVTPGCGWGRRASRAGGSLARRMPMEP